MHQPLFRFKRGGIQLESQFLALAPPRRYRVSEHGQDRTMTIPPSLDALRAEIDSIDATLHDLLMRRAAVSEQVRAAKQAGRPVLFRPGREAAIIKRLLARHSGALPPEAVVQVWREIIASSTRLQGPFAVAVYAAAGTALDLARAQFGVLTPLLPLSSVGSVLAALDNGQAQLGVLPLPEDLPDEPWWRGCGGGEEALCVLARLPYAATALQPSALIVGRQPFEPTGDDRGYLVLETDGDISRARLSEALTAAGLKPRGFPAEARVADGRGAARPTLLVEIEDHAGPDDRRLEALREAAGPGLAAVRSIGGYAVPIQLARPHTRR
jgi:chorismate mutase/prephenate dehydratase